MLALGERLDGGWDVFVFDTAFAAKVLNVGKLVDTDSVFAVKRDAVEGFAGGEGLFGGFVLDEGVAVGVSGRSQGRTGTRESSPFSHFRLFVHGHEDSVWLGLANFAELLAQELDEFWFLVLGNDRAAVDNDKGVETLVESHFMLFAEI